MSEHQIVAFRAIDRPVPEVDLEYMRRQSSRAEVTPWSFDNEYHFGDFRGNDMEMLSRGYDIHLHYANFGIRKLLIRFPYGLPDEKAAKPYFTKDTLRYVKDKKGQGATLRVEPAHEPGDLPDIWDLNDIMAQLQPLRAEILDGDLRPLYIAHLAMACDGNHDPDETKEPPAPAGLGQPTNAQRALMEFYGLSDALIAAGAPDLPPIAKKDDPRDQYAEWLQGHAQATKDAWLAQLMLDPHATVRMDVLAAFRKNRKAPSWPTVRRNRTITELERAAVEIQQDMNRKSSEKAAREKAKRLADIAADPAQILSASENLVAQRSQTVYVQIAKLLTELREALAGTAKSGLAERQAQKLKNSNPTLHLLTSELRRAGFLPKK